MSEWARNPHPTSSHSNGIYGISELICAARRNVMHVLLFVHFISIAITCIIFWAECVRFSWAGWRYAMIR